MSVYDINDLFNDGIYEKQAPDVEKMFKLFSELYVSCIPKFIKCFKLCGFVIP